MENECFHRKLNIHTLAMDSSNCAHWKLSRGVHNYCAYKKKICTWTLIVSLFIIDKTQKKGKCPLIGQWVSRIAYSSNGLFIVKKTEKYYPVMTRLGGHTVFITEEKKPQNGCSLQFNCLTSGPSQSGESEKMRGCLKLGEEKDEESAHRPFRAMEILWKQYGWPSVTTCLLKSIKWTTLENTSLNSKLEMAILMQAYQFYQMLQFITHYIAVAFDLSLVASSV